VGVRRRANPQSRFGNGLAGMLPVGHNPNHDAIMFGDRIELSRAPRRGPSPR
jgi:hypothetical protein